MALLVPLVLAKMVLRAIRVFKETKEIRDSVDFRATKVCKGTTVPQV